MKEGEKWHVDNGYEPSVITKQSVNKWFAKLDFIAWTNDVFTILMGSDDSNNKNTVVLVFNSDGVVIDERIYFNPPEGLKKVPKRAFIGTPIIDGSKPMKFVAGNKKDKPFQPPI
ncbi:hypothetical protein KKD20_05795 [Patescibacteria group bacterium]|nr:hypothetical protein [Patescibacteria group bacterium]